MFERGITVLRVRKIPIRLHISLLLFLPYVAFIAASQFAFIADALDVPREAIRLPPYVWGVLLAVGLFASILVHELAHAFVALKSGGRVHSITLMMLGGVTRMDDVARPRREAWMAFAGPLTSFVLALMSWLSYRFVPTGPGTHVALAVFAATNLILAVFNLLPAFPMDGGRVLRGLLAQRVGHQRATEIATSVGRGMAIALGLLGLFTFNLLLVLIAGFVYLGASAERSRLEAQKALSGLHVGELMRTELGEAHLEETAAEVARRLLRNNLVGARVIDGRPDQTLGIVTTPDVARAAALARNVSIRSAMRSDLPRAHPEDDASVTLNALASGEAPAVVVVDDSDTVLGLVTQDDLQRAVTLGRIGWQH